ncbi:iron complex transport system ATP-binding protein [Gemmobacter aquatilis]|uniref:Iron complex transport system ATP-binding protein n=1 Tax=Gemmobacter aquatilis TaxID=933059 RepID=A0A1H8DNQ3_9RHOB|nr:ABC transporter ATP-binding protein [Gemmobacter aquatilis]SEN08860.1 iron complex transport system ATP-binding protein [Gemmobacter aquatilis]
MSLLTLDHLTVRRDNTIPVNDVSLTVAPGECIGLIGPNGAGKTTLLRAALGLIAAEGHSSLAPLSPRARAARVAWLPQQRDIAWAVSVGHLVSLGATARGRRPDHPSVAQALARMGLAAFRDRPATALSGGEQARVLIARALAQDTPLLLVDEPIAGLDPAQQIRTMRSLRALADDTQTEGGRAVVVSLHDLGLAARHCTRLIVLQQGRLVADGPPAAVLTEARMASVFGIACHHVDTPDGPVFQPMATVEP